MRCQKLSDLKESIMKPIGKVIKNILYQLELVCPNENCQKSMNLEKYEEHEYICYLPKCQNYLCKQAYEKSIVVGKILYSIKTKKVWIIASVLKCVSIPLYFKTNPKFYLEKYYVNGSTIL